MAKKKPAAKRPARKKPGGQGAKLDGKHIRQHAKMIERAIRERWIIPEETRQQLVPEIWAALRKAKDPRAKAALAKVIVAADAANLKSEMRDDKKPPTINVAIINQLADELRDTMTVEQLRAMYLEARGLPEPVVIDAVHVELSTNGHNSNGEISP